MSSQNISDSFKKAFPKIIAGFLFITVALAFGGQANSEQSAITNQTIFDMVKAKLPADLIVTKIQTSRANFDLSTDALVKLNQSGVPSEVIKAMMEKNSGAAGNNAAAAPAPVAIDPNDPNSPHDPGIYAFYSDGRTKKMVMLEPTVYTAGKSGGVFKSAMTYGIAKVKWKAVVRNPHANVQISDPNAVFYFYFEEKSEGLSHASFGGTSTPNEFTLVKFDVKGDSRETAVMKMNAFGASSGTDDKANIAFNFEKLRPGIYRVTAKTALAAGEYCFLSAQTGGAYAPGAAQASRLFDFGIVTE